MIDETIICNDYKAAKDKQKQIGILAELNAVDTDVITDILHRHGLMRDEIVKPIKKAKTIDWTKYDDKVTELLNEGYTVNQIARRLYISAQAIYDRRQVLKKKHDICAALPQQKTEKAEENTESIKKRDDSMPTENNKVITFDEYLKKLMTKGFNDWSKFINYYEVLKTSGFEIESAIIDLKNGSFAISGKGKIND